MTKRKKPLFLRTAWRRLKRIGRKKKRKWRYPKGGDSKTRKRKRGYPTRPSIGWRSQKNERGKINGKDFVRVENVSQLTNLRKGDAILVASVGRKKREDILKKANEIGLIILNKYKKVKNESEKKT